MTQFSRNELRMKITEHLRDHGPVHIKAVFFNSLEKLNKSVDNKEFLCITHTVEHNYISPSSRVGIQLHVSVLYVGHLQVVT